MKTKYRKKPVVIEAFQLKENFMKIRENCKGVPDWAISAYDDGVIYFDNKGKCFIKTLEGVHHVSVGDYIIQDINSELYPRKPDIFEKTYDSLCAEIRNLKVIIERNGDITVVYLDGENSKGKLIDFSFHADVETGERIVTFSGRRNKLKLFFDTEFTGLHKETMLISIGIVSEDGKKFYAEFTDFDWKPVHKYKWLLDNVVNKLHYRKHGSEKTYMPNYHIETKASISEMFENWLNQFDEVQFVSDVCHYDFVLLIDLFGGAFDLPKNVSAVCYDINQDIARYYGISDREAFDKSREDIVSELCGQQIEGEKHNALYKAEVIKVIYEEVK